MATVCLWRYVAKSDCGPVWPREKSGQSLFSVASHSPVQRQSIPPEYTSINGKVFAKQKQLASVATAFLFAKILFRLAFYITAARTTGTSTVNCLRTIGFESLNC